MTSPAYRGRFAPSPTGPLHFGSLVAAVAGYADARHHGGTWLIRIDDVDQVRCRPDAERQILQALQTFGMQLNGPLMRQSKRTDRYLKVLEQLASQARVYRCTCSRKAVAAVAKVGAEGPIYPGTCWASPVPADTVAALRVRVSDEPIGFHDRILGEVSQNLAAEIGDFILRRIDGVTAYQLAVIVDDFDQGINQVVRGADLLWSTPRQIWLQRLLDFATPQYAHIPLVYASDGHKLSKRDNAHPVDLGRPVRSLRAAWAHLGQITAPADLYSAAAFWDWAIPRWNIRLVPKDRNNGHERTNSV